MNATSFNALVPRLEVSDVLLAELVDSAGSPLGGWGFGTWRGPTFDWERASQQLRRLVARFRRKLGSTGYGVIALGGLSELSENASAGVATYVTTAFGEPLRVFSDGPHWREVGVDPDRPPNRSRGTGLLPLHMDFVNAQIPPDVVCLYCVRPDPLGGGVSIVVDMQACEHECPASLRSVLEQPVYTDGMVKDLHGIGGDINPFAVISRGSVFPYRYTGHLCDSAPPGQPLEAIRALSRVLERHARRVHLAAGDLLFVDQRRALHGRLPLGEGQVDLNAAERRMMMLSFLRNTQPCP